MVGNLAWIGSPVLCLSLPVWYYHHVTFGSVLSSGELMTMMIMVMMMIITI